MRKKFRPMLDVLEAKIALDGSVPAPVGITTPIETVAPDPASAAQLQEMNNLANGVLSNSTQNGVAPFPVTVPGVGSADPVISSVPALPATQAPAPYSVVPSSIPSSAVVLGSYGGPSPVSLQAVLVAVPKSLYPQLGPVHYI